MQRRLRLSALSLLAANLVPLAGVLLWGWSVGSIIVLYWFENVVLGVINVARMIAFTPGDSSPASVLGTLAARELALSEPAESARAIEAFGGRAMGHAFKLFIVPFCIVHYFMFCAGHGVFVFSMFRDTDGYFSNVSGIDLIGSLGRAVEIFSTPLALAAVCLAASHLLSFFVNYIGGGEYRRTNLGRLMMLPYSRIVVLHLTIIFGGLATLALGEPIWVLVILVTVKIGVDLKMHILEHGKAGGASQIEQVVADDGNLRSG